MLRFRGCSRLKPKNKKETFLTLILLHIFANANFIPIFKLNLIKTMFNVASAILKLLFCKWNNLSTVFRQTCTRVAWLKSKVQNEFQTSKFFGLSVASTLNPLYRRTFQEPMYAMVIICTIKLNI